MKTQTSICFRYWPLNKGWSKGCTSLKSGWLARRMPTLILQKYTQTKFCSIRSLEDYQLVGFPEGLVCCCWTRRVQNRWQHLPSRLANLGTNLDVRLWRRQAHDTQTLTYRLMISLCSWPCSPKVICPWLVLGLHRIDYVYSIIIPVMHSVSGWRVGKAWIVVFSRSPSNCPK